MKTTHALARACAAPREVLIFQRSRTIFIGQVVTPRQRVPLRQYVSPTPSCESSRPLYIRKNRPSHDLKMKGTGTDVLIVSAHARPLDEFPHFAAAALLKKPLDTFCNL